MNIILYTILTLISTIGAIFFSFTGIAGIVFAIAWYSVPDAAIAGFAIAIFSLVLQQICIKLDPSNKYEE